MARDTANANQELLDLTLRRELTRYRFEDQLVNDILRLLDDSVDELEAVIRRYLRNSVGAAVTRYLQQLLDDLKEVNDQVYGVAERTVSRELQQLAEREVQAETLAIQGVIEKAIDLRLAMNQPSPYLLRSIVTEQPWEGELLSQHWETIAGNREALLINTLNRGLVQGESVSQLVGRVVGTRDSLGRRRGGVIRKMPRAQATSLVRTWAGHVSNASRQALYVDNDDIVRGVLWVSTLDNRTTPICQARDHKAYDLKGNPIGHHLPWLNGPGAAHWQCRSSSVALLHALEDLKIDWSKVPERQRASYQRRGAEILDGRVPANEDFPAWAAYQPFDVQAEVFRSVARAEFFRDHPELAINEVWAQTFQRKAA